LIEDAMSCSVHDFENNIGVVTRWYVLKVGPALDPVQNGSHYLISRVGLLVDLDLGQGRERIEVEGVPAFVRPALIKLMLITTGTCLTSHVISF
jgi:hypothetical protein